MFWKRYCSSFVAGLAIATLLVATPKAAADDRRPVPTGGEFTLSSLQGPINLSDLRGKVVLLFFGYTSCPDICPISLARIGACLSSLDAEQAQHVQGLFVTLDPGAGHGGKNEPVRRASFTPGSSVSPATPARSTSSTAQYGIAWERKAAPESALGYSIAHPDTILLVDADGALVGEVRGEDGSETLRAKVLDLLARRG